MRKGSYGQYIVKNQTIDSFIALYDRVLVENGFRVKDRTWVENVIHHKAISGDTGKAFLVSTFVPFGRMMEAGNRYGAEAAIYQSGQGVVFRLLVVPYMTLFDRSDIFLLSQGIFEKVIDDDRCREKMGGIVNRLMVYRVEIYTY